MELNNAGEGEDAEKSDNKEKIEPENEDLA